jgi:hypothetical protein
MSFNSNNYGTTSQIPTQHELSQEQVTQDQEPLELDSINHFYKQLQKKYINHQIKENNRPKRITKRPKKYPR